MDLSWWRSRLETLLIAVYFSIAPSSVPGHRLSPAPPPAAVLVVGDPIVPLVSRK